MKKILFSLTLAGICLSAKAQELPQPSPKATLEQRVGLTDIKVEYSRPGVKEREIFGNLVPYDKLWRTGANMATTIEFSSPVNIGGESVEEGKYSLLTIPNEGEWVVILNSKADMAGTNGYSEDMDVARVPAEAQRGGFVESFTIDINNIRNESAMLVLAWAETKVMVPIEVETMDLAMRNIKKAIKEAGDDDSWQVYRNAANFYFNNNIDNEKALDYINKSLSDKEDSWYSHFLKAEILAEMEHYGDAAESAAMALEVGLESSGDDEFGYADMIKENINKWREMAG